MTLNLSLNSSVRISPGKTFPGRLRRPGGFTLVELLVVMIITSLLLLLALPPLSDTMNSYLMEGCGESVQAQLALAQQTAMTRNEAVQVRLYQLPDYHQPTTGLPVIYRGMQSFLEDDSSGILVLTPLSPAAYFPAPVMISPDATLSTLLTPNPSAPSADPAPLPLGIYGTHYLFSALRFMPNGKLDTTNLSPAIQAGANYCLTLVLEHGKTNATTHLPANFVTLQIDSLTGNVRKYQP